jgi:hypothetical protein
MKTLTLRVDGQLDRWLTEESKRLGKRKSDIIREALAHRRNGRKALSVHDRMGDVCGVITDAPRDLSTNLKKYLEGFGE